MKTSGRKNRERPALQKQTQKRRRDAGGTKEGAALFCGAFFFGYGFCL
jgi:hypothetical protein